MATKSIRSAPNPLTPLSPENPFDFVNLFNDLPGIECFVKDTHGRRVRVSEGIWRRLGFSAESEMLGKTDHDVFPPHIADQYIRSDQMLLATGRPLIGNIEIWINEQGVFDWFIVNKYPIFGLNQKLIGIMGTLRAATTFPHSTAAHSPLGKVVDYIREHCHEASSLAVLTKIASLSERHLRRRFQQEFGIGLGAFVLKARIHAGANLLLKHNQPISEIALNVGFCDQSAFTRAFRDEMGLTPREYRLRYTHNARPQSRGFSQTP